MRRNAVSLSVHLPLIFSTCCERALFSNFKKGPIRPTATSGLFPPIKFATQPESFIGKLKLLLTHDPGMDIFVLTGDC